MPMISPDMEGTRFYELYSLSLLHRPYQSMDSLKVLESEIASETMRPVK